MATPINFATTQLDDWLALNASNRLIGLSAVPGLGGRVIDLSLADTPVFYRNPRFRGKAKSTPASEAGAWKNYGGSKVWPAPQGWSSEGQWPGPPDRTIDCGSYRWQARVDPASVTIHLESPPDEYTGISLAREIRLCAGTSTVDLLHTIENTSRRPVRWSIWQVTQVDASQGLEIVVPASGFHQTFGDEPYRAVHFHAGENRVRVEYQDQVAKLAVEANQGWFAVLDRARGFVFAETFPRISGAHYPDNAPVAFWISGHGTFTLHGDQVDMTEGINGCDPHVESEVMSPLVDLEPGENYRFRTRWHLAAVETRDVIAVNHCGVIGQALAFRSDPSPQFHGSYGVFWNARGELVAYDRASQPVATFDLGLVSPCRPLVLEKSVALPLSAVRCSLVLRDENNNNLGVLDHVDLRS